MQYPNFNTELKFSMSHDINQFSVFCNAETIEGKEQEVLEHGRIVGLSLAMFRDIWFPHNLFDIEYDRVRLFGYSLEVLGIQNMILICKIDDDEKESKDDSE